MPEPETPAAATSGTSVGVDPQAEPAAPSSQAAAASAPAEPQPSQQETETAVAPTAPVVAAAPAPPPVAVDPAEIRLWLGSLPSRDQAEQQWTQLQESYADLFRSMDMQIGEVERDRRIFYRVLAGPLPDRDRGREICRQLQSRDPEAWCKVVGGS